MTDISTRRNEVISQLSRVIDPEIGADIVRLGMIYDVDVAGEEVTVKMTLTTPGCPMQGAIAAGAERVICELPWVESATINLVWDPPWNPGMIQ